MTQEKFTETYKVFQFCPQCQAKITAAKPGKIVCAKCGLDYYINEIPCCGLLLLNDKNELLLVERRSDPKKGFWDVPGGFIELNETAEQGMVRECREETGINFQTSDLHYFSSVASRYPYKGMIDHILVLIFSAKLPAGEIVKAGDDAKSAQFFPLAEIPLDKIAFPAIAEQIAIFRSQVLPCNPSPQP